MPFERALRVLNDFQSWLSLIEHYEARNIFLEKIEISPQNASVARYLSTIHPNSFKLSEYTSAVYISERCIGTFFSIPIHVNSSLNNEYVMVFWDLNSINPVGLANSSQISRATLSRIYQIDPENMDPNRMTEPNLQATRTNGTGNTYTYSYPPMSNIDGSYDGFAFSGITMAASGIMGPASGLQPESPIQKENIETNNKKIERTEDLNDRFDII